MSSEVKQEKLSAPVILAVISGSLMLIGGVASLVMMVGYHIMYGGHRMFGMMMYGGMQSIMSQVSPWLIGWAISSVICGVIVLYCSYRLYTSPQESRIYGIVILIVSGFGIIGGHGFWIGSILGIISGVMAVSRK